MFTYKPESICSFNLNCCIETEALVEVKGSCTHCESGCISEMVQDRHIVTTDHTGCMMMRGLSNCATSDDLE